MTFLAEVLFVVVGVDDFTDTGVFLTLVLVGDADFYLRFLSNNSFFLSMTRVTRSNYFVVLLWPFSCSFFVISSR